MKRMYFAILILFVGMKTYSQNYPENWLLVKDENNLFGFVDLSTGEEIIFCQYDAIYDFGIVKENWALVKQDGVFGIINDEGEVVLEPMYEEIGFFDETTNLAFIKANGLYGMINKSGEVVLYPQYTEIYKGKKL